MEFEPQEGFQEEFLGSEADIVIGGAAAGVGKTWALLYEACRYRDVPGFGATIFRKTYPQIKMQGGLWDESLLLYPFADGRPREGALEWIFPSGVKIYFRHLQHDKNMLDYQGAQIPLLGFDELTHFSKEVFFYILSRNRSLCGIKPYVRATCNPDPDSWVAEFIKWWINQDTGFPIPERVGIIRFFTRHLGAYIWGDSKEEVLTQVPDLLKLLEINKGITIDDIIKSVTFIPGDIYDNKKLLQKDPSYIGNLLSQDEATQDQLLRGNWKVRTDGMELFDWDAMHDIFSNIITEERRIHNFIIIDHARFGKDFCVIGTWEGLKCVRIDVWTKSDTDTITNTIQKIRTIHRPVPVSHILVDQDGIGVVDRMRCRTFQSNASPFKEYYTKDTLPGDYKNMITQLYYKMAEKVNDGEIFITDTNIFVDGKPQTWVKYKNEKHNIRDLIMDDLRSVKKEKLDLYQKKQITSKEDRKVMLNGRSPDFGDMIAMRGFYLYTGVPKGLKKR